MTQPETTAIPYTAPLTFGAGASVDWHHGIDPGELRRQRPERMRAVMREQGVAVMLVAGPAACRYLTGLRGPEYTPEVWFVLFPAEGDPVVFAHAGYINTQPKDAPWIREWRLARAWLRAIGGPEVAREEAGLFARDVRSELEKLQLADEPLAVVGFDAYARPALEEAGIHVIPGEDLLQQAMAVKTPEGLSCLRMAGGLADRRELRGGHADSELSAIGKSAGSSGGSDGPKAGFRSGALTLERAGAETR